MKRQLVMALVLAVGFGLTLPRAQTRRRQKSPEVARAHAAARNAAFVRSRLAYMYQHPGVTVVEDTVLTPESGSDDILENVRLVRFSDATSGVEVSLHPSLTAEDQEQNSFIVADRSAKTYRTFRFQKSSPTPDEQHRVRQYLATKPQAGRVRAPDPWASETPVLRRAAFTSDGRTAGDSPIHVSRSERLARRLAPRRPALSRAAGNSALQYDGCFGYYFAAIWTVEAALRATALDYIEADWGDSGDNWWGYGNVYAWAANPVPLPPPFNTHWFVDWEYPFYDPFPWWGTAWSQDDAQFHNDDFPFNIGRVYTNAGGYIDYEYGGKYGGVYWYASGSWTASYLYGQLQAGGSDGCYYGF